MDNIGELFGEIVEWATARGAESLNEHPGLWRDETSDWTVEINGHAEEIDGLPYAHARLVHKKYLQIAILSPFTGAIGGGATEDELIEHFRSINETAKH